MSKPFVLAVAGATASGKSELAMQLAKKLDGEIICMDSMQIYRRMDIGTAKPTHNEQADIPHHMLDIIEPTETYAVADYAADAQKAIERVLSRGHLPVLTGGTGLYLKALMHGLSLGGAGSDPKLREQLNAIADETDGKKKLHERLMQIDPLSANRLHPNDVRRVVRAIEVFELTGKSISEQTQEEADQPFSILPLAIDVPRNVLYERHEKRVHHMIQMGLVEEVSQLLRSGVTPQMQSMQGIGYKELIPVVENNVPLDKAVWQIILNTRHYAKRQGTWLRTEPKTVWLSKNGEERIDEALYSIDSFLNERKD